MAMQQITVKGKSNYDPIRPPLHPIHIHIYIYISMGLRFILDMYIYIYIILYHPFFSTGL